MAEPNNRGPRSPSAPFQTEVVVRFGDCDPAGIVFYPRYLEFFNNIVEDWCREGLKFSFDEIVIKRGWGLPTVHLDVDFVAPSRLGDFLTASLTVERIGTSSVHVNILLAGNDGSERVSGKVVLVLMDRREFRSMAIPDDLRSRLERYLSPVVTAEGRVQ